MKTKLLPILFVFAIFTLAAASFSPIDASDGIIVGNTKKIIWQKNAVTNFDIHSSETSGAVFARIYTTPNETSTGTGLELATSNLNSLGNPSVYLSADSPTQSTITLNKNSQDVDTITQGSTDVNLIYADASTNRVGVGLPNPSEKLEVAGNIKASGTVAGSNLAGINTGDQVVTSMLITSLTGYSVPANSIAYTAPGITGTGSTLSVRVPLTQAGTFDKIMVCTSTAQPATGSLNILVYINSSLKSLAVSVTGAANCFTGTGSADFVSGNKVYIALDNNATTASAAISAITFNVSQ